MFLAVNNLINNSINRRKPAHNTRFYESGGVTPQKKQCVIASASPAASAVKPPPRQAAGTLWAGLETDHRSTEKPKAVNKCRHNLKFIKL